VGARGGRRSHRRAGRSAAELVEHALLGGIALDGDEMRVAGLELHDAAVRVVDAVERLPIGVRLRPAAPAVLPVPGRNPRVHVEPVAVLEAQVALVHGLEAGPARGSGGAREESPEHGETGDHAERVPPGPPDRKRDRQRGPATHPFAGGMGPSMFTGLVEAKGLLRRRAPRGSGFRLEIATGLGPLALGESVSVNGACLTVVTADGAGFEADVSVETSERTTLGSLPVGGEVNLERALAAGARLGGHLVTGHVDGIATVTAATRAGEALRVTVEPPAELLPLIAEKGSVALDGVSLTVNRVADPRFEIMLIPHTMTVTTLGAPTVGQRLNLEVDLVARYVVRYLQATAAQGGPAPGLEDALRRAGFIG
jgi:riboflavin synthase